MDFESLENMDKSEFFPLSTIKQELLDTASTGDETTIVPQANTMDKTNTNNDAGEITNPVCDSADKQV